MLLMSKVACLFYFPDSVFHREVKVLCAQKGVPMQDWILAAIKEKYALEASK
jgi:hypothetical protein